MPPVAVLFDLFGTLLDITSLRTAARHTPTPAEFVATWREKQIAYAFAATIMDRYEDFDAITLRALRYAAQLHAVSASEHDLEALAGEWRNVRPFDDAVTALTDLRARGVTCAVLTNGTLPTAHAALNAAGMTSLIDVTLSVDAARVYKPDVRTYRLATTHFATTADRLIFVTSNGWDATGATEFGLPVAWCNRAVLPRETLGSPPRWEIRSLAEFSAIIGANPAEESASDR